MLSNTYLATVTLCFDEIFLKIIESRFLLRLDPWGKIDEISSLFQVGEMSMISVGPLDQVVGIQDDNDRAVVIRTGISPSDLSGKTWKVISAGKCEQPSLNLVNSVVASAINRPLPEKDSERPQVTEGSSNANFKKAASNFGDRFAKNVAATVATGAVAATVGRIPIGKILTNS